jgi:hypothetical protein
MTSSHQVATLAGQVENLGHEFSLFGYPKGLFTLAIFARRDFHLLMDVNEWINYECTDYMDLFLLDCKRALMAYLFRYERPSPVQAAKSCTVRYIDCRTRPIGYVLRF